MIGYRRVFEDKFRDGSAATDYAKRARWSYVKRRGFLKSSHLYQGVIVAFRDSGRREVSELRLVIQSDGYVALFYKRNTGVEGCSSLPDNVWDSLSVYEYMQACVKEVNEQIAEEGFIVQCWGNQDYRLIDVQNRNECARFEAPIFAIEWVRANVKNS